MDLACSFAFFHRHNSERTTSVNQLYECSQGDKWYDKDKTLKVTLEIYIYSIMNIISPVAEQVRTIFDYTFYMHNEAIDHRI